MVDLETRGPTGTRRRGPMRAVVAGILAAAAVVAIALVVTSDGDVVTRDGDAVPADEPTESVPPPTRALFGQPGERFVPGTYVVDEVWGIPTAPIFVTIGAGWTNISDKWAIGKEDLGYMNFSRPDTVFSDACHSSDGNHPGPLTTLDGLVAALSEQGGWADVTAPSDISVDGYAGKAFQRTAPAEFVDCSTSFAPFRSWGFVEEDGSTSWSYYSPGEIETLWVLDVDGTIIILVTRMLLGSPAAAPAELAAMLDSIRIDRG